VSLEDVRNKYDSRAILVPAEQAELLVEAILKRQMKGK